MFHLGPVLGSHLKLRDRRQLVPSKAQVTKKICSPAGRASVVPAITSYRSLQSGFAFRKPLLHRFAQHLVLQPFLALSEVQDVSQPLLQCMRLLL